MDLTGLIISSTSILAIIIMVNILISRKNRVDMAYASVDAMLKKRYDLIPNLLTVAQKYMGHEKLVLSTLTSLRTRHACMLNDGMRMAEDKEILQAMKGIMAVAESYPALRASENYLHLQGSLNEVEEQISAARRAYNAAVTDYNNAIEMIPLNFIARIMSYRRKPLFEITENERRPVVLI